MVLTRNAEATQKRLMDAALALYAERGYAGTCLDAILERASSSKGAFYHHFQSKEDLTARALERHWQTWLADLEAYASVGKTPAEKLARLCEGLEPSRQGSVCCPLGLLGFESCSLPPQVQRTLRSGLGRWSEQIAELLLALGMRDAEQARMLAEQLFVMYEGGVLLGRINGSCQALRRALRLWRQSVERHVLAPE